MAQECFMRTFATREQFEAWLTAWTASEGMENMEGFTDRNGKPAAGDLDDEYHTDYGWDADADEIVAYPVEVRIWGNRTKHTDQQDEYTGGGTHGWNRVTVAGEIRDCGDDAQNLDAIASIEARGHIAVRVTIADASEIREYVDDATEAAAQEAFWACRAAEQGVQR